jgi:hypothetical protein
MEFFDRYGNAHAYSPDAEHIYLWRGTPVAYFRDDRIFSFNVAQLDRFGE